MKILQTKGHAPKRAPLAVLGASLLVLGCAGQGEGVDESQAGQIIGGVAGAAAGSQIGGGSGQTIATVAGALIGSVIGERIGANMEEEDLERTALALEKNRRSETSEWINPNTGQEFSVTPVETYERDGQPCREFRFRVETEQGSDVQDRTACRTDDGTWQVLSS